MKNAIGLIVILIGGFFVQQYLPWWSIAVVTAIVCSWLNQAGWQNFLLGFLGAALLWGAYAGYIDMANGGIMSGRMGELLGGFSGMMLVVITALLGGLIGGLGGMTGGFAGGLGSGEKKNNIEAVD